jgi:hypothetical protein
MFIRVASIDDSSSFTEINHQRDLSADLVEGLITSLDGDLHTLVTLSPGGEAHMAIGGDASNGLIVYSTTDNKVFYNLRTDRPRQTGPVLVAAGGQPGEFDSKYVVTLAEALIAAISYAETGQLSDELNWDRQ